MRFSPRMIAMTLFMLSIFCFAQAAKDDIMTYALMGSFESLKAELKAGTSPNTKNKYGITVLMFAVSGGYTNCVHYLVEKGADVNAVSDSGDTALMLAASSTSSSATNIAKFLVLNGAKVDAVNKKGKSPLSIAEGKTNKAMIAILKNPPQAAPDMKKKSGKGSTGK